MLKLDRLVLAMAEHEGWSPPEPASPTAGSRSYRNHNPLNLRQSPLQAGTREGFAYFYTDYDGFAAARWDIRQKAKGNTSTGLNGSSTLRQLIHVWAPPNDGNDTESYVQHVCEMTGFDPEMKLAELI